MVLPFLVFLDAPMCFGWLVPMALDLHLPAVFDDIEVVSPFETTLDGLCTALSMSKIPLLR